MSRPPIDPQVAYTVLSQSAVRRHLTTAYDVPRHKTANLTLDQLYDQLSEHTPGELGGDFVVITDRAFERFARHSTDLLIRYHGLPVDEGAGISSMSHARETIVENGVEIPDDADRDSLEDVLSAIRSTRYLILTDEDFTAYGAEMAGLLATVPTGRAKAQGADA